jgi:Putative lumazine-binding
VTGPDSVQPSEPDRPTAAPFLGALAIFALVVIAIILFNVFGTQKTTPGDQVAQAAVGQNDALQRQDYGKYRNFTCRADEGTEATFLAGQRDSVAKNGERYVNDVPSIRVDGDRATATVIYHFANTSDQTFSADLTFVREDGAWRVCSK